MRENLGHATECVPLKREEAMLAFYGASINNRNECPISGRSI
jgi:hypothetical protein